MRSLQNVLTDSGVDLTGWQLHYVLSITGDGKIIAGHGNNPSGNMEAFVVNLNSVPEPGYMSILPLLGALMIIHIRHRRSIKVG